MEKEMQGVQNFDREPVLVSQYTINHTPDKFVFDFRSMVPQFGPDGKPTMVLNHKVAMFEPYFVKQFLASLKENIKRYEDKFGKIKKPEALKEAEKEAKKNLAEATTGEKIGYVG